MKEGKILQFKKPEGHPQMEQILKVLRGSFDGFTPQELAEILSIDGKVVSKALTRLQGKADGFRSRRVETHRKRRCAVTGRRAPVWRAV